VAYRKAEEMSFSVFLVLFVALCGWLDARIGDRPPVKQTGGTKEGR